MQPVRHRTVTGQPSSDISPLPQTSAHRRGRGCPSSPPASAHAARTLQYSRRYDMCRRVAAVHYVALPGQQGLQTQAAKARQTNVQVQASAAAAANVKRQCTAGGRMQAGGVSVETIVCIIVIRQTVKNVQHHGSPLRTQAVQAAGSSERAAAASSGSSTGRHTLAAPGMAGALGAEVTSASSAAATPMAAPMDTHGPAEAGAAAGEAGASCWGRPGATDGRW